MGKFDDDPRFNKNKETFAEDVYGDVPVVDTFYQNQRLQQRAQVQQNATNKQPEYVKDVQVEKTMDLMFVDGKLHQKVIENTYTIEVNSGESVLNSRNEKWVPIESKSSTN